MTEAKEPVEYGEEDLCFELYADGSGTMEITYRDNPVSKIKVPIPGDNLSLFITRLQSVEAMRKEHYGG